jgi:hypothetical protein
MRALSMDGAGRDGSPGWVRVRRPQPIAPTANKPLPRARRSRHRTLRLRSLLPCRRRAELNMIATSGRLCAAAAHTGGNRPRNASVIPTAL